MLPPGCTPVVFHTAVLIYLEPDAPGGVRRPGARLGVRWIAQESAGIVPGIAPRLAGPDSFVLSGRRPAAGRSPRRTAAGSTG